MVSWGSVTWDRGMALGSMCVLLMPPAHAKHLSCNGTVFAEESEEEDTAADDEAGAKSRSSSVNDFSSLDEEAMSG